jgi:hypothetical protein
MLMALRLRSVWHCSDYSLVLIIHKYIYPAYYIEFVTLLHKLKVPKVKGQKTCFLPQL